MSRKRCVRKHYALVNPLAHVLAGIVTTPSDLLDKLRLMELSAIESLTRGNATQADLATLADMVNVAWTMANDGIGPEVLPVVERAEQALGAAHARFKTSGHLGFDGPGLQAVRELAEFHDLQRASISRGVYERCIKRTADRIKGSAPDVKVYI